MLNSKDRVSSILKTNIFGHFCGDFNFLQTFGPADGLLDHHFAITSIVTFGGFAVAGSEILRACRSVRDAQLSQTAGEGRGMEILAS